MKDLDSDYEELLKKEKRRRNIKIVRHGLGLIIMSIFVFWLYFFGSKDMYRPLLMGVGIIYILYSLYRLSNEMKDLYSLTDELHYEDGELIKYNPKLQKAKKWIPIESVEEVYFDVEDKPNLLFVVYREDEGKKADSFYKERIKDEEKFMEDLKEKSLIVEESISFEDLKEKVKTS